MLTGGRPGWEGEVEEDCRVLGIPLDSFSSAVPLEEAFEVWPGNELAVDAFFDLSTQWEVAVGAMGGALRTGLRYVDVEAYMRMTRVVPSKRADLFRQLHVMERAALDYYNRRR